MKLTENFVIQEFVPRAVFEKYGENSKWFIHPLLPHLAQFHKEALCELFDENVSVVINNWHAGGRREWSGLRTYQWIEDQLKAGRKVATLSQHLGGTCTAFDSIAFVNGKQIDAKLIDEFVIKNQKEYMKRGLTTIEGSVFSPTWTHLDLRWTGMSDLLIVGA